VVGREQVLIENKQSVVTCLSGDEVDERDALPPTHPFN